ncbi:5-oxoprolinase (ATP-hydrolyzing) [Trifolium repens]|nr:5-oxoprolinase (ATP-hydrolyzing) [Trifolium repens]
MATILRRSYGGAAVSFSSSISLSRRFVSTSSVAVSFPRDSDAIDSFNAIKSYLQERVETYMKRKVLGMSQSFDDEETNASLASPFEECSKGRPLHGFEDEKFWYVASRREQRPRELCPIDSTTFETLKVQHANINQEDIETDHEDRMKLQQVDDVPCEVVDTVSHDSNAMKTDGDTADDEEEDGKEETFRDAADDIIFKPAKREVRSIDSDAMETNDGANDDDVGEAFEMRRVGSPPYWFSTNWSRLHITCSLPRVPSYERKAYRRAMRLREKLQADKEYQAMKEKLGGGR